MNYFEILEILGRSVMVSGTATLLAAIWSFPVAYSLSASKRRVCKTLVSVFNSLVGIPTVLIGLLMYLLLSRSGPAGFFNLLYTPQAIILGQAILITPLMISFGHEVIHAAREKYFELALSLGASSKKAFEFLLDQSFPGLLMALLASFSRAIGELGIALMIGGNIRGYTRVMTTALALEVTKGEFELAIYLGLALLGILIITALATHVLKVIST
jgi:tungstate transport system permease protein